MTSSICPLTLRQVFPCSEATTQFYGRSATKYLPSFCFITILLLIHTFWLQNKCNVGYAFINMTDPSLIIPFYEVCMQLKLAGRMLRSYLLSFY